MLDSNAPAAGSRRKVRFQSSPADRPATSNAFRTQGLMLAPVITLTVAAPLNVILNYLLVWGPQSIRLGFVGAPLATAISMNAMVRPSRHSQGGKQGA